MGTITCGIIARRLGVSRWCAWQWSRKGRFGWPIDETAKIWRWEDNDELALMLSNCHPTRTRGGRPGSIWPDVERQHLRRMVAFADGSKPTDAEDLEAAATILAIAARRFVRRAAGQRMPATGSAVFLAGKLLARIRAGDADIPKLLIGTSLKLSALAEKGNTTSPPAE